MQRSRSSSRNGYVLVQRKPKGHLHDRSNIVGQIRCVFERLREFRSSTGVKPGSIWLVLVALPSLSVPLNQYGSCSNALRLCMGGYKQNNGWLFVFVANDFLIFDFRAWWSTAAAAPRDLLYRQSVNMVVRRSPPTSTYPAFFFSWVASDLVRRGGPMKSGSAVYT